jgi:hypothetical protein
VLDVTRLALALVAASFALASLPACGGPVPAQTPEAAAAPAESASAQADMPAATAAAAPDAPGSATGAASPAETLAHDLLKAGGRRIAFSAGKKRFMVPIEMRTDGGRGLDLRFYDDEGSEREILRVCQPGECEERLDELVRDLLPKVAARIDKEGYEAIYAVGWPSGQDEIDVNALGGKLQRAQGRVSLVREKKTAPLRALGGKGAKAGAVSAVYPAPGAKLLGAFAEGDRGSPSFCVFKLP